MRILIAEDDFNSRLFMEKYLSRYGQCDVAINGIQALECAKDAMDQGTCYNLICLDIMMPKIDGIEALKTIRELEEKVLTKDMKPSIIFMISALNDEESKRKAYEAGCQAYAWKPIDIAQFDELLRNHHLI